MSASASFSGSSKFFFVSFIIFSCLSPKISVSQERLEALFDPQPEFSAMDFQLSGAVFDNVKGTNDEFGLSEKKASVGGTVWNTDKNKLLLSTDLHWFTIDNDDLFALSGVKSPTDLYDLSLGALYRTELGERSAAALSLNLGTAARSGDLFKSIDEMYISALPSFSFWQEEEWVWMIMADVDTRRDEPIYPGVGARFLVGKKGWLAIGFPFLHSRIELAERFALSLAYRPERNITSRLSIKLNQELIAHLEYSLAESYFVRAKRTQSDDRVVYDDQRVQGRIQVSLAENTNLSIFGGWAFDRGFGEGDSRRARSENSINVDDGWFGGIEIRAASN